MEEVLKVEKLNKSFGKKKVLTDVSFTIKEGDILGFVGPNGAGKTTTIKLILGLQKIDSGKVYINGYNLKTDFEKALEKVGAIVENPDSYMYLSGRDNLKLNKNMYHNITNEDILNVTKAVGLEKRINDKVKKYSLGMRQRLSIANALLNKPKLLILDEPTNGLDPMGIKELRNLLKKLSEERIAILISSHNLRELETFCNRICIIKNGVINSETSLKTLKEVKDVYIVKINDTSKINTLFKEVEIIDEESFKIHLEEDNLNHVLKKLLDNNYQIYEVKKEELSLEDAFLNEVGGNTIA